MKRLSATVLAIGLLASGVASAQSTRYYGTTDRYGEEPYYDYARVVRVDPIIDNGYGRNDGYANTTTGQRCYYRNADDVYARDEYRDGYRNDGYPDDRYGDDGYYGDRRYPDRSNESGRTVATVIGGIAGGAPKPYIFDTGSSLFNAAYNPAWWGTVPASSSLQTTVVYCYGSGAGGCRGYTGNIVEVPSLGFYATSTSSTAAVTLSAAPGYQVNAVYKHNDPTTTPPENQDFPAYFQSGNPPPPVQGYFYGTFGAANFASEARVVGQTGSSGFYVGGVLGREGPGRFDLRLGLGQGEGRRRDGGQTGQGRQTAEKGAGLSILHGRKSVMLNLQPSFGR